VLACIASVEVDPGTLMALARHGEAIATARAFLGRSGAQRVVLLVDLGDGEAAMVDCDATGDTEVVEREAVAFIPATAAVPVAPKPLPQVRPTPATAIDIDVDTGELAAPLGAIDHLASSVLAVARAFGGLTVATAEFPTRDPELPITVAARDGEPVVLAAGDAQYELGG
jgi:hypothetical protein